ncbi:extracellular solute-binding protein [Glycomyces sp. L485]|uniref:extracellular solute-binding protein n=1 Tax=Glycomyces sp. L485 TaxID=2909235 RepID=UPI001F4A7AE8|nr:extracellular solute-binding protein [Glycomyces sp. L485]MCH7231810.1 extracellular solute-binding protein [Glycomyces sp. L485]
MTAPIARRGFALLSAAALAAAVAACGTDQSDDTSEETAAEDEAVVLYSGRNEELIQPILDDFTAATGIEVDVRYSGTAEAAGLLLEEGEQSPADLFLAQDAGALGAVSKAGLLSSLDEELLGRVPETYRASDGTWVGLTGRSRVLIYDPAKIAEDELPESVWDLTNEEWEGRVAIAPLNGSFQAFVTALRVESGDEAAAEWLEGMADAPQREKNGPIVEDVAAGELEAGLVNHYYIYEKAAEAGVPVEEFGPALHYFSPGDAGGLVNVSGIGALGDAAENENVAALLDYLLAAEAQTTFAESTFEYPLIEGVAGPEGQPALEELVGPEIDLNDLDDLATTVQMIQEAGLA